MYMKLEMLRESGTAFVAAAAAVFVLCGLLAAGEGRCQLALEDPDDLNESERISVLKALHDLYPESMGFRIEAPLEPEGGTREDFQRLLKAFRVVVVPPGVTVTEASRRLMQKGSPFKRVLDHGEEGEFLPEAPVGYSGVLASTRFNKKLIDLNFITVNMNRWLIWARENYFPVWQGERDTGMQKYAAAVSQYMRRNDFGKVETEEPKAADSGAPSKADLYGSVRAKDYDTEEYASTILAHRETDFHLARGVMSFTAGAGAIEWLADHCGEDRFEDENQAHLQRTFQAFVEDGRSYLELRTLTPEILGELDPGRYFYAVDEYSRVRFGPMRTNEDQYPESLWKERMKGYECLLFPGQPILAAGEFTVEEEIPPLEADLEGTPTRSTRLESVNAFSAHFFYRPGDKRLRKQVNDESDDYIVSTGHFLSALKEMGVSPVGIRISKF